ncbi:Opine dehydrogenase [Lentibacillus sp. JNUCC-1]|uniref:NAD/NADP-dependent octopine/nopaline dehydrogenase family protein n=1 Tax=Lentibacillus sp. JNUCC-1 TaxID=2654513 RepID=UPI0012E77B66|nr:NAD/NADP-dependent octopine/nopaline dehydrogenase family protein [Lentibacillus sp. JNUCC-1]MUV38784.1 Opine dehydrogenase [Lentibacillus sp. JNUCC-1]
MKVAVLGAGSVGSALAGYYGMKNLDVRLYELPEFEKNIKLIKEQGGVYLSGSVEGFGQVGCITTDMEEAISGATVVFVTVPAYGHKKVAEECAKYLTEGQVVAINSGSVFAALEFDRIVKMEGNEKNIAIVDISNLMGCRKSSPGEVNIHGMRKEITVAAIDHEHAKFAVTKLEPLFDNVETTSGLLEIALNNNSTLMHPAPAILNAGWIETSGGNFDFYWGGISPSVGKVMEAIDSERIHIGRQLDYNCMSFLDKVNQLNEKHLGSIYEYISTNPSLGGPKIGSSVCPSNLQERYVSEDVPYGLVPYSELAKKIGIQTPHIDSLITLASRMNDIDYRQEGRNLKAMGVENKTIAEIKQLLIN